MRKIVAIVLTAVLAASVTGCSALGFTSSVACAQWIGFDSEEDMAGAADVVVVVNDIQRDGTLPVYGFDAHAYSATVTESVTGGIDVGESIRVASTADNCAANPYGEGDPMLSGSTLRLYLSDEDGMLRTLTPFDGVVVVDD